MAPRGRKWVTGGLLMVMAAFVAMTMVPAPLEVETAPAAKGRIEVTVDEDGEVRAHDRYVVSSPVAGRLARVALHDGDPVARDQVVAEVMPVPLSAREREEQLGRIAAAEAAVREAQQRARHARADLEQARRDRERAERLVRERFLSPQAVEQARIAETTAAAESEAARSRAEGAAADLRTARAARIALDAAGSGSVVRLRAPADGFVLRVLEQSERVVSAGQPLLTVGDPARLELVLDLLSTEAVRVRPGMPVAIGGWGGGQELRGHVRLVEPHAFTKVSALGVEEQRVNVIVDFEDSPVPLGDGYRADGRVVVEAVEDALKVPVSALFRAGEGWAIFVVEEGRARRRMVQAGVRNQHEAQIVSGLAAGATVIRHPSNDLADGMRVRSR